MVQMWMIWADDHGYGEDAYSMSEEDILEMAQTMLASMDEQGIAYAEFEVTDDMVAWANR